MPDNHWPVFCILALPFSLLSAAYLSMKLWGAYEEPLVNPIVLAWMGGFTATAVLLPIAIAVWGRFRAPEERLVAALVVGTLIEVLGCMWSAF